MCSFESKKLSIKYTSLYENESTDFEGDRTYRVHIETARQLIMDAYNLGKSECVDLSKGLHSGIIDTYRSNSKMNQNDDMFRITLHYRKKENMKLYHKIKDMTKQ